MIIKFDKDRRSGGCKYLKEGKNKDRDKKDIRIQLTDKSCFESIGKVNEYLKSINKYDRYKDNYKHIIISSNKDKLDKETLKNIAEDFVKLYMHAYFQDEYTWYAEAHIPKKSFNFNERGEERRSHIHIFIHKYSLKLDRRLRFSTHPVRRKEINLIKHYLIKKYNLNYTLRNKTISRSRIDYYTSEKLNNTKKLKNEIINYIHSNLQNYTEFKQMIKDIEEVFNVKVVKISKNAKTPYISIHSDNLKRNIRLKGLLFNQNTFAEARKSILNKVEYKKYDDEYFLSLNEILEQLAERQKYLKREAERCFSKIRERIKKEEQAKQLNITIQQLNKIIFKLNLINQVLNININSVLKEFKDVAVFNNNSELKLIDKNKNVNISIKAENNEFNAIIEGKDEKAQAKILAGIIAEKIKEGKITKNDLIITGTAEFKNFVLEFLDNELNKEKEKVENKINLKEKAEIKQNNFKTSLKTKKVDIGIDF